MREAIGLVETIGLVGAVEALDVALKAANVSFLNITYVKNGIVTITISGDVGAVKAAIDASEHAARKLGCYRTSHVIPRPNDDVYDLLNENINITDELLKDIDTQVLNNNTDTISEDNISNNDVIEISTLELEILTNESFEEIVEEIQEDETSEHKSEYKFQDLKVSELKDYIYKNIGGYSKNELKKMNKEKLLDIAMNHAN